MKPVSLLFCFFSFVNSVAFNYTLWWFTRMPLTELALWALPADAIIGTAISWADYYLPVPQPGVRGDWHETLD